MNLLNKDEVSTATPAVSRPSVRPRYEVKENSDAFVLTAWVPGVDRTSLETTLEHDTLTVVGRRAFTAPEGWTAVHREIPQSDYRLTLEVGQRVNRDAVRAELNQGLLTLTLPKAEAAKPRKIEITG